MGWFTYDLSRGVDLLLEQKGIDAKRIIVVSEPAGGGDVAAVAMAVDSRITGGVITSSQVQNIQNSGHAPTDAKESAIIASLPPGNYTAIVRGVNNTTGVALVEVYDLH